ncbi:MAG: hypothetical protein AMK72_08300 [Planctomycetes bacterium SM23_25]|nr:MAG: hypothetical protein AMK72_08300 [Planctomycetes bacterium SM23_25]
MLIATLVAASLTGVAAAAEPSKDAADTPAVETAPAAKEDRGWFSRVNPFSPLVDSAATKKTEPGLLPEGTLPEGVAGAAASPETPQVPKDEAEGAAQSAVPVLNGILFSDRLVIAIVSDAIAKTGDLLDGYRITSITRDTVVAEKQGRRHIMTTRRPQAQLDMPPPAVPGGAAAPAVTCPDDETPSSALPQTADNTPAGPHVPATGASESTQAAPDGAEQTP